MLARYSRTMFLGYEIKSLEFWFASHRTLMQSVFVLTIAAFIVIFYKKEWNWVDSSDTVGFSHSIVGILTISLTAIQPVIAFFRPGKYEDKRPIFNWVHRSIGLLTLILSFSAIFLGIYLVLDDEYWVIFVGWMVWVVLLVIVLEIVEHKSQNSVLANLSSNESFHRIKAYMFVAHVVISVVFTIVLTYFVATN